MILGARSSLGRAFSKRDQAGVAVIPVLVVVLLVGVAAFALTSSRRGAFDQPSTPLEAVEQILKRICPTKQELILAVELAEEIGNEDVKERVRNKKSAPWCSTVFKMKQRFSQATQRDILTDY